MTRTFADFAKGFWEKPARTTKPKPTTLRYTVTADSEKRRQLTGQMAGIILELVDLPSLSDNDRRVLNISSAVAFLLAGR